MQNNFLYEPGEYDFFHFTPVQIRFNDIDMMGHVNNAIYQHYFDYARIIYFADVFGKPVSLEKTSLILASIYIDYLKPLHIDNQVIVASKIILLGNKSFHMIQEIHKAPEKKIMALSQAALVAYDNFRNYSVNVPAEWKKKIIEFEKEVRFKYA